MNMLPSMRTLEAVAGELKAVATAALALPLRPLLPSDAYDPDAPHPIPVVLVHGLCGDPTNFLGLKRALRSAGISKSISNFSGVVDVAPFIGRCRIRRPFAQYGAD